MTQFRADAQRPIAAEAFVDADAEVPDGIAVAALALARRFDRGATVWCWSAVHDDHARHVAVEFVHPAVLGARALPAVAVERDAALVLERSVRASDSVIALVAPEHERAQPAPAGPGCRTARPCVVCVGSAEPLGWFDGRVSRSYHLLWELVQICLEHLGAAGAPTATRPGDLSASDDPSGFLYPFLDGDDGPDAIDGIPDDDVLAELQTSAAAKVTASRTLVADSLRRFADPVWTVGGEIGTRLDGGGRLLTLGNGGSAADAGLFATLCADPPEGVGRAARSLASDSVIATALANDLGADHLFARQVDAHVGSGDVVVAFSTSGESRNVCAALDAARSRGALTVALVGSDGGRVAATGAAHHCLTVQSDSVHRVQEVHAALSVALWRRLHERAR